VAFSLFSPKDSVVKRFPGPAIPEQACEKTAEDNQRDHMPYQFQFDRISAPLNFDSDVHVTPPFKRLPFGAQNTTTRTCFTEDAPHASTGTASPSG
jgi:hypothetical protein